MDDSQILDWLQIHGEALGGIEGGYSLLWHRAITEHEKTERVKAHPNEPYEGYTYETTTGHDLRDCVRGAVAIQKRMTS